MLTILILAANATGITLALRWAATAS